MGQTVFDIDDENADFTSKVSNICPISLLPMVTPYKSTICGHVFEKQVILNYIEKMKRGKRNYVKCPASTCSKKIKAEDFEEIVDNNNKKRRRSSFSICMLPPPTKKRRLSSLSFEDCLPSL